jgi:para-aminobenzoate synthetase component I
LASSRTRRLPWLEPVHAFRCFADDPGLVFFDSGGNAGARSRFSTLCLRPYRVLRVRNGVASADGVLCGRDAFAALAAELAAGPARRGADGVPFSGGAAGFIGYEMGATLDRAPTAPGAFPGIPDLQFGFYDTVLAFDHHAGAVWLFAPSVEREDEIAAQLSQVPNLDAAAGLNWQAETGRETHLARVREALRYIQAGDIYQANIAARFTAERAPGVPPAALYLALRAACPAPFGAFIACGDDAAVLSVSPERFMQVSADGMVETRPIKGTRPRGASPGQDDALKAELLASEKDRAENLMIVDLLRNDMARVADGVSVSALCALESFSHVHHLVSTVTGRLRKGFGPVDLLRAGFPGGSITGAPKLRAMEIIAELEGQARGPYCGCAAWIGFDGAMDSNILIRTLTVTTDRVIAQAGGGIVADSDPAEEWDEVLTKMMPLLRATGSV